MDHVTDCSDIVVVGAGITGATLAWALAESGLNVTVIESGSSPEWNKASYDPRVNAINIASQNILVALGVWHEIQKLRITPFNDIKAWGDRHNQISFHAADAGLPHLGHIIETSVINVVLHKKLLKHERVVLHYGQSVNQCHCTDDQAIITINNGKVIHAKLLVGADGALSRIRQFAHIRLHQRPYDQKAIVAHVATQQPNQDTAYQRFLSSGPLALLPFGHNRSSMVWSADTEFAEELMGLSDFEFLTQLNMALEERLGEISLLSCREEFPLVYRHSERYIKDRIVLVGDAAHTVHPLAGLGANQGLMDAATLAEILIESSQKGKDFGQQSILRRYERWRRAENQLTMGILNGLFHLFASEHPAIMHLRNLGLNITDQITPLKLMLIRRATGVSGDLPKMAQLNLS